MDTPTQTYMMHKISRDKSTYKSTLNIYIYIIQQKWKIRLCIVIIINIIVKGYLSMGNTMVEFQLLC